MVLRRDPRRCAPQLFLLFRHSRNSGIAGIARGLPPTACSPFSWLVLVGVGRDGRTAVFRCTLHRGLVIGTKLPSADTETGVKQPRLPRRGMPCRFRSWIRACRRSRELRAYASLNRPRRVRAAPPQIRTSEAVRAKRQDRTKTNSRPATQKAGTFQGRLGASDVIGQAPLMARVGFLQDMNDDVDGFAVAAGPHGAGSKRKPKSGLSGSLPSLTLLDFLETHAIGRRYHARSSCQDETRWEEVSGVAFPRLQNAASQRQHNIFVLRLHGAT